MTPPTLSETDREALEGGVQREDDDIVVAEYHSDEEDASKARSDIPSYYSSLPHLRI